MSRRPPLQRSPSRVRTRPLPPVARGLTIGLTVGLVLACQAPAADEPETETGASTPPPIEAVASVRQIMDAMVIPTSAAIWNVASEAPADEEAWKRLENAAAQLTEAGNLLLIGDRSVDDDVWRDMSVLLRTSGAQALAAATSRDAEGVVDAGNVMIDSCELCHEKHLVREPPPEDPPS